MARVLIVYGSKHGQAEKVARYLAELARRAEHTAEVYRGDLLPLEASIENSAGVIVCASVHHGRHQRYIEDYCRAHRQELAMRPSAFFSVSLAGGSPEGLGYIDRFLAQTGWRPSVAQPVAGALRYREYGPLTRWVMRASSRRSGRPTDTSRDYEFTDWPELTAQGGDFLARLPEPLQPQGIPPTRGVPDDAHPGR